MCTFITVPSFTIGVMQQFDSTMRSIAANVFGSDLTAKQHNIILLHVLHITEDQCINYVQENLQIIGLRRRIAIACVHETKWKGAKIKEIAECSNIYFTVEKEYMKLFFLP